MDALLLSGAFSKLLEIGNIVLDFIGITVLFAELWMWNFWRGKFSSLANFLLFDMKKDCLHNLFS